MQPTTPEPKYRSPIGLQVRCLICRETEGVKQKAWVPTGNIVVDVHYSQEIQFINLPVAQRGFVECFHASEEDVGHPGCGIVWFRDRLIYDGSL